MTSQPQQLPETRKVETHLIESGRELEAYQSIVVNYELEVARVAGVTPMSLEFRVYGERLMWRLTMCKNRMMTNDEAKTAAFVLLVRCFGAYKPEFFKSDNSDPDLFVGVWFTNGAQYATRAIKF